MKNVLLFTGQGSQFSGMGAALAAMLPEASAIYEAGSDILGFDLKKNVPGGGGCSSGGNLPRTACHLRHGADLPGGAEGAGHCLRRSMRPLSGGIRCHDRLRHADGGKRFPGAEDPGASMDEAAKSQDSGMYAILRMPAERIGEICAQTPGYVVPVNFNSPAQTVIAGERQAVDAAAKACAAEKARAVPLAVAAAFHSKLMQPAADAIAAAFTAIPFAPPTVPFYTNLTGEPLAEGTDMAQYCAKHCVSPVRFAQELQNLHAAGFDTYIELGPKKVLTSFVKQTLKDVDMHTVTDPDSLEETVTCLKHTD